MCFLARKRTDSIAKEARYDVIIVQAVIGRLFITHDHMKTVQLWAWNNDASKDIILVNIEGSLEQNVAFPKIIYSFANNNTTGHNFIARIIYFRFKIYISRVLM